MIGQKLTVIGLAILVVGAGAIGAATAMGPTQSIEQDDERPDRANDTARDEVNESAREAGPVDEHAGPPVDLPDTVPSHVEEIHLTVRDHIDGALNVSLGEAVSGIVADGGEETTENGTEDVNESETRDVEHSDVPGERPSGGESQQGVAGDRRGQVPEDVGGAQAALGGFLDGAIDSLGAHVSGAVNGR